MFSKQETFNLVWNGLKGQGFRRAVGQNRNCKFQTSTGLRCALGHLVPEGVFPPDTEINEVLPYYKWHDHHDIHLTMELVEAHDDAHDADELKDALRAVAEEYDLEVPQ